MYRKQTKYNPSKTKVKFIDVDDGTKNKNSISTIKLKQLNEQKKLICLSLEPTILTLANRFAEILQGNILKIEVET